MKKIIDRDELKSKIIEAIDMLCNPVKSTIGPKGLNVIISESLSNPYITNDGVTIARNIESEDEVINTILELAKESTIKTDEVVGDGTSTTLVLLQSIYKECLKLVDKKISPMIIQKELLDRCKIIESLISKKSKKPNREELLNIAITSSNDIEIGKTVFNAFNLVKDKKFITIREGDKTELKIIKGYIIDTLIASPYFLQNKIEFNNPYILLCDSIMYDIESISEILNYIYQHDKALVIISKDYDDGFINEVLSLVINDNYKIILLKLPEYGNRQSFILKDLSSISNSKICHEEFNMNYLGSIKNVIFDKEKTIFNFDNNLVKNRIKELNVILKNESDEYEIDFIKNRIAMLKNKTAIITVGGNTKTIRRERIMRFTDSLCAIDSAYNGVLPGSGIVFYEISNKLNDDVFSNVFKVSLKEPLKCILNNAGVSDVLKEIENREFKEIYNVNTDKFENVNNTLVLDSKEVLINSLSNAISVATTLLSTSTLVINEIKKQENNIDYNL